MKNHKRLKIRKYASTIELRVGEIWSNISRSSIKILSIDNKHKIATVEIKGNNITSKKELPFIQIQCAIVSEKLTKELI